jgi:hypothetical protein
MSRAGRDDRSGAPPRTSWRQEYRSVLSRA